MKLRILLVVLGLLLAACGGDGAADTTTTPGDETTTTGAAAMTGVRVGDTEAGSVLVGPDGLTLYVFTSDTDGESTCNDACADLWPPVPGDTDIGSELDASIFGTTTRDDGSEQLTVNDMPLYWYEPDEGPGDAKGQGFNGVWFTVDPEGDIVEASADSDNTVVDYGYGG
ncbi:MAG: hypothetical protein KY394_05985 [Actinobacteria bacterium]|nr:hypothetical protein [Actinomycetota bacterium]